MNERHILTGRVFDRLTVISCAGVNERRNAVWLCRCECGSEIIVSQNKLSAGAKRSCGCLRKDMAPAIAQNMRNNLVPGGVLKWARETGGNAGLVYNRVSRGWTVQRAMRTPKIER